MDRILPSTNPYSASKILIVDDEPSNLRLLERLLGEVGLSDIRSTTDPRDAESLFVEFQPDLILLDLIMPHLDGFAILNQIHKLIQPEDYLPILVLTANVTASAKQKALISGASDFLTKPFDLTEVTLRIFNLLRIRNLHLEVQKQKSVLEETVAERTVALREALRELAASQRQTVQQQRLQALGLMASGVAHDFNNSLNLVLGFTEFVLQELKSSGDRPELVGPLQTAMTAALDGAKIVSRLVEFHRPAAPSEANEPVDMNLLVEQAVQLTEPRWKRQGDDSRAAVSVTTQLAPLPLTSGDPAELREALINLIFNAVDAMPGGGMITLQTDATEEGILLQVRDTGTGMSEEVRERCFEPFFSTKGEGGTGLGLAVVYGIIERHHGRLEVESAPGKGTTFKIFLPRYDGAPLGTAHQPPAALKVLIVDARPMLCNLLTQYLEHDLHTVTRATSGSEALEKVAKDKFDLVIADQDMPVMNGDQLVAALKRIAPSVRTVIFNRFSGQDEMQQSDPSKDVSDQPITITELRQVIRRAMQ